MSSDKYAVRKFESSGNLALKNALPPDPSILEYSENWTEDQKTVYECYLTAGKTTNAPMNEGARLYAEATGSRINVGNYSKKVRRLQWKSIKNGWTPVEEAKDLKVDEVTIEKNKKKIENKLSNKVSTFVITYAQNATPVHSGFLASLENYCKHRKALLTVVAGRYKNPTSVWTEVQKSSEYWAPEVAKYLVDFRYDLNDNLTVLGDAKIQPTNSNPTAGAGGITQDKSCIIGHPKIDLVSVATPQNKWPKLITTTGAITQKNYTDSWTGKKAEFHHSIGATVVEVQGEYFHMRQIAACKDGSFIDLDYEYTPTGYHKAPRALGLVLGDIHVRHADPDCEEALFGKGGMVDFFNPEKVILHDWYDGYSGSHHHRNNFFIELAKRRHGFNDVKAEVIYTFEKTAEWMKNRNDIEWHIVDSNHNQHLVRWIQETDPRKDLDNLSFWSEIVSLMEPDVIMGKSGAEVPNPLQVLAEKYMPHKNLYFNTRGERVFLGDIDCTNHGHQGVNGARGSIKAFSDIGVKCITGHGHAPGIKGGHYRVGTNSRLDLEYTGDLSSWLHTDCVVYANGKRSLIHKFNGQWKASRRK